MDLIENCKNSENCEFNEIQSEFAREIFEKLQNWKLSEKWEKNNIEIEVSILECHRIFEYNFFLIH